MLRPKDCATAVECIRIIRRHFGKPVVSPITFIITNFLLGKFVRDPLWHRKQMQLVFSEFEMTPVLPRFIEDIFNTHFVDIEDGSSVPVCLVRES